MTHLTIDSNILITLLQGRFLTVKDVLDRKTLFGLLNRHKLLPLAVNLLDSLEEKEREFWIDVLKKYSVQSLELSRILLEILTELNSRGIEAIPIKGPVLAQRLYGDVSKRHSGDLDMVINKNDLLPAIETMKNLGFRLVSPKSNLSRNQRSYFLKYKKEYCVFSKEIGLYVELHVGIYDHGLLKPSLGEIFLQDLIKGEIGGIIIQEMNMNNSFLYLAYHGGHHLYYRLFWLRDISEALYSWNLDHRLIFSNAKLMGIERLLLMSLNLANIFFGNVIPHEYSGYLEQNKSIIEKLSRICISRIFGQEKLSFIGKIKKLHFNLLLKSSLKYKWTVITNIIHRWYISTFLGGH